MAQVDLENITKSFGKVVAVNRVSLQIKDHEFFVMLGPSGAGKTTSLRLTAGLTRPDHGRVLFDGECVDLFTPAERDVAMVFQSYALYPRQTVFQNIASPLAARKINRGTIDSLVREMADKLHIQHLLERYPNQLSGGEQQRVALARAMVRDQPRVFLMDEPLTNLDFKLRVEMRAELKRLHEELNVTFFYVTNDQLEAMSMADRVAVLNKGVIQQMDTPANIYTKPVNLFVASFIGSPTMNFLECSLNKDGDLSFIGENGDWRLDAPPDVRPRLENNGHVSQFILGVRPEDFSIVFQQQPGTIPARVFVTEPLGDRNIVDLRVGKTLVKVKTSPTFDVQSGSSVWLLPNPNRMHLFNRQDETALR
ncbi:MAG: ABC transporter ATP-binding protein [Omnitrophica WOR_2 bacterium]